MRMRCLWWMHRATNTHSKYVILIAFPLRQWLHESTSLLHLRTLPVLFYSWQEVLRFLRFHYVVCFIIHRNMEMTTWKWSWTISKCFPPTFHEKFGMFLAGWLLVQRCKFLELGVMRGGLEFITRVTDPLHLGAVSDNPMVPYIHSEA